MIVSDTPVAVIGAACRLPGARSLDEFWDVLANGRCVITEVDEDRFGTERENRVSTMKSLADATLTCWLTTAFNNCAKPSGRKRSGNFGRTCIALANCGCAADNHAAPSATQASDVITRSCIGPMPRQSHDQAGSQSANHPVGVAPASTQASQASLQRQVSSGLQHHPRS